MMGDIAFQSFYDIFTAYHSSFSHVSNEIQSLIQLKCEHSLRVSQLCTEIGHTLDSSNNDLLLLKILGIFHDIGRFPQLFHFGTFLDRISINHATFGVQVIEEKAMLQGLPLDQQILIKTAIIHHNLAILPGNLEPKQLLFSKILRDADKLDILKIMAEFYSNPNKITKLAYDLSLPDDPSISTETLTSFLKGEIVSTNDLHVLNDFKLLQIAWIHDLNFPFTRNVLKNSKYIHKICQTISKDTIRVQILKKIDEYFDIGMETR